MEKLLLLGEGKVDDELLLQLLGAVGLVIHELVDSIVQLFAYLLFLLIQDVSVFALLRSLVLLFTLLKVDLHEFFLVFLASRVLLSAVIPDFPQSFPVIEVQLASALQVAAYLFDSLLDVRQFCGEVHDIAIDCVMRSLPPSLSFSI